MNVGSLFSGIGGMDCGLARAGLRHVFFCESDPYRREVLAARWPGVVVSADVRAVGVESAAGAQVDGCVAVADGAGRVHSVAVPDLLCGGFPCQDLSVAGQRRGLAGERSGLFFEFARIIDAFRPGRVLIENVPGLLSSNGGRDFGVVLGTLADLGYGVAWRVLDSRFFGVPQRRRRVFIVGAVVDGDPAAAARRAGEILAVGSRCPGHPPTGGQAGTDVAVASISGLGNGGPDDNDGQAGRLVANTLRQNERNTSQVPGNYVTNPWADTPPPNPWIAAPLTKGSASGEGVNAPGRRQEDDTNIVAFDTYNQTVDGETFQTLRDPNGTFGDALPAVVVPSLVSRSSRGNAQGNSPGHNADESLIAFHPTGGGAKGLSPTDDLAPGTGTGDGGTVAVAYPLARRGRDGGSELEVGEPGVYNALRAGDGGSSRLNQVMVDMAVRRLTPIECERLQGLPDGWTVLDAKTPDSRRYSALGDAVTANVAEWIGGRILNGKAA